MKEFNPSTYEPATSSGLVIENLMFSYLLSMETLFYNFETCSSLNIFCATDERLSVVVFYSKL